MALDSILPATAGLINNSSAPTPKGQINANAVSNTPVLKGALTSSESITWRGVDASKNIADAGGSRLTANEIKEFRIKLNNVVAEFNTELKNRYGTKFDPIKTVGHGDVVAVSAEKLIKQLEKYTEINDYMTYPQECLRIAAKEILYADHILDLAKRGQSHDSILRNAFTTYDSSGNPTTEWEPSSPFDTLQKEVSRAISYSVDRIDVSRKGGYLNSDGGD
jgi:hypothetical protein